MKAFIRVLLALLAVVTASAAEAQAPAARTGDDKAEIRALMDAQVAAWNRGDIPAFMQVYENSPETTFIGQTVNLGFEPILKRYQLAYENREQMGTLTFSGLEIRLLPSSCGAAEVALVTGRFHLERAAHGAAAKDDGIFSLVWHKGPQGWKIVLDHTA